MACLDFYLLYRASGEPSDSPSQIKILLTPEKLGSSGTVGRNSTTGADLVVTYSVSVSVPGSAPKHERASRIFDTALVPLRVDAVG